MKRTLLLVIFVFAISLIGCAEIATEIPGTYLYRQKKANEAKDKRDAQERMRQWQYKQTDEYKAEQVRLVQEEEELFRQEQERQKQQEIEEQKEKERIANLPEPVVDGWTYLGKPNDYFTYKKTGSTNEFMLIDKAWRDDPPTYIKMESWTYLKKNKDRYFWVCEKGARDEYPEDFACHLIVRGLDKFQECMTKADRVYNSGFVKKTHSMTRQQHNDWLWEVSTDMCKRNYRNLLTDNELESVLFAYKSRTYSAPDWDDQKQRAKQAEQEESDKLERKYEEREQLEAISARENYVEDSQPEIQSSNQMEILEHKSGGCTLIITNQTVFAFEIKVNGVSKGTLPTRKVARIKDLNCDGFMAEAWPQGTVTGSVHRAFQHNQKDSSGKFHWTLKYR
jgi:hypothetical protein